jgi:hypothetical protein
MKWMFAPLVLLLAASFGIASLSGADETDKATEAALKEATENAKRMGLKMPDLKALMDEADKDDKKTEPSVKEGAKDNAPAKEAKTSGPNALPDWTPPIPQFTPAGPVTKKVVDGKEKIVLTGTSPLSPVELADEWENKWEQLGKDKFSLGRLSSNINNTVKHTVTYRLMEGVGEVELEATRAPRAKVTQVVVSSPLPKPAGD